MAAKFGMSRNEVNAAFAEAKRRVYAAFCTAARNDEPCPTTTEILAIGGGSDKDFARRVIRSLERDGLIKHEALENGRRVTILATGKTIETATVSADALRRAAFGAYEPVTLPPRVDRDPCPFCGVRRDIGCKHIMGLAA